MTPSVRGLTRSLAILLLLLGTAGTADSQQAPHPFGPLVDQIRSMFPKVEGDVLEAQGQRLTLSVGRRDGLKPGVELEVFREGHELRHPRTGALLGRTEQILGRAALTEVLEAYSVAQTAEGMDVRPGDRARLSAGRIRITLLALSSGVRDAQVEAAVREFSDELTASGRFQVMAGDALLSQLGKTRSDLPVEAVLEGRGLEQAAAHAGVEQLLVVLFKRVQNKSFMEVRFFPRAGAAPMLSTALFVPSSVKPAPKEQFSADPRARPTPQPKQRSLLARLLGGDLDAGTYSSGEASIPLREVGHLSFPVLGLDAAVAPKDRVPRVVLTDGSYVHFYRLVGEKLEVEWTYSAWQTGRVISVQLMDLDGDGALEVVVNRYHPRQGFGLTSFVITMRDGKLVQMGEATNEILLAVDRRGAGVKDTLWLQRFTPDGFFTAGHAERLILRNDRLVTDGRVRVPWDFRATGTVTSNIAGKDGPRALVYIDPFSRLRVAIDGEERWRSGTAVGGSRHVKLEVIKQMDQSGRSFFYYMEGPPLSVDLDGDGIEEIIAPITQAPGQLAVVFRGPAGYRLQSVNTGFEGTITGLGGFRMEDQGTPTLVLAVVRFTGLLGVSGESQIIMTAPQD
ncbi:MAG: VCBS repeat-containing protein [Candidatus Rokuibacteriota bacterium]